ncbi:uncharacterized protein LOC141900522 isoform X2 [Tubulanus polymorphus]|uniref:uncharacterized protein LOC141900522 isoform X2 n=1 Tax=Tubulanus polymorphus TaxID=672921 RepID=UPI003DA2D41B
MASMGDKTSPLEEQLKRLYTYREMLRNSFEDTAEDIKTIKNTIGDEVVIPDFKSEEIIECHDNLGKDPTVLVCGQVNCGKSSLINQLLKGNRPVLPISDQPCTARLVRLYYSPTKQITLKSKSGGIKRDNLPFRRRTLKQLIHLPEKLREQENEISDVVEIGLDNELLRCGLQLIDAPGINEGEGQLGDIVEKYIDGTLQLLLYVIDGNRSFNKKDLGFITAVKTRCPGIEIIYVCNKVEEDRRATTMDTPDDEDEETFVKSLHDRDKASLVYKKLYSARLVNKNVHDYKQSEELFGISCEMIEKAQRCDKQDEYEEYIYQYQRLLKRIGEQYSKCFKDALSTVATRLNMIQKRVFDYCLNDKVLIEIRAMGADDFKEKLAQLKASVTIDPDKDLKNLECSKDDLVRGMECRIDNMLERLRDDVRQLELGNNIDDNRKIILDFVLMRVLSKWQAPLVKIVDVAVCCLTKTLEDILEMAKPFDDFISESICLDSLISLSKTDFSRIVRCELKELGKKFKIKAMKEDFVCLFGKTLKKDSVHWKCSTAEIMLKSIDTKALIERLLVGLKDIIRKVVDEFASLVGTIETHYSQRVAKRDDEVLSLCDLFPPFGSRICLTEALKSTLEHETVQLGEALASGHRGVVYNGSWRGLHSICCAEEVVFKVWNSDRTMPNYVLGQTWNFERMKMVNIR